MSRAGAKTILLERNGVLGGTATSGLMVSWNVRGRFWDGLGEQVITGIPWEIHRRLVELGSGHPCALTNEAPPTKMVFELEHIKGVLIDLLLAAGVEILTHTMACDPILEGRHAAGIYVENKSGRQLLTASQYVDCTGDLDVCRVDCTQAQGSDTYFESAPTRVVGSAIGDYREAAAEQEARFGYRFDISDVGCPHELIVRYPDDKPRFMCVMDGSTCDLSTGVFSGDKIPVSGRMREIRLLFWPRWPSCTLVFATWCEGRPAAVASFEVWKLDGLPAGAGDEDGGITRREFGMAFEDPCGMGLSLGASTRPEWIERLAAYMRHTGQTLLIYPIAWYHGPQFPSDSNRITLVREGQPEAAVVIAGEATRSA